MYDVVLYIMMFDVFGPRYYFYYYFFIFFNCFYSRGRRSSSKVNPSSVVSLYDGQTFPFSSTVRYLRTANEFEITCLARKLERREIKKFCLEIDLNDPFFLSASFDADL